MPIYQYKCNACGHQLEALQKMSDAKLVECPSCSSAALKKQLTAAAFKLKGTGWYETDFKNSGVQPNADNGKNSNADDSTKTDPVNSNSDATPSSAKTSTSAPV